MSKKSFIGKSLAVIGAAAAIGGVCYVFRDKIKESKIYNDLDMDEKLSKVKSFVNNNMSCDDYADDDFFFDEDEDTSDFSSTTNRGYVALNTDAETITEDSNSTPSLEDATEPEKAVSDNSGAIPTISFDDMTELKTDEPEGYEYQGLSDVSEDPDVLEDQDKLDF